MHPTLVCSRIPICASLSKFANHFVPMLHIQGSLPPTLSPATTDIVRLKLKEHIHTTSIYTELCFICYKISPLVFFSSVVSLLPTVYLTREIDDIKFSLL